jgi:hypothetical protein
VREQAAAAGYPCLARLAQGTLCKIRPPDLSRFGARARIVEIAGRVK